MECTCDVVIQLGMTNIVLRLYFEEYLAEMNQSTLHCHSQHTIVVKS
jgi:hypothetical protein